MKSKTILGADGTTEMREITVGIHGKGGEVGIRAVQRIAGMVSSLKQCKTPQEVYDRYLQITGYCKCCIDCGFMDEKGADRLSYRCRVGGWCIGNGAYLHDSPEYVKKGQSIMKKIDWVRKLTSRKLWTAVASFVSMMIVATGGAENTATQVTALIMAGASVVAYIIGEGLTDSANIGLEEGEVTEE